MEPSIEEISTFCKKKGFIFPTAEIYGGLQGFYDYGPNGIELKNNIKQLLWKDFVKNNPYVVGMEGSLITNPKVWKSSGHVDQFVDILSKCSNCGTSVRVDTIIEEEFGIDVEGKSVEEINKTLKEKEVNCPKCKNRLNESSLFHLMFETNIGPEKSEKSKGYLRPETAQLIFADFKTIFATSRLKLPFGIAQIGKAFRNEISPRNFLFRMREFEQFEIEFFTNNGKDCAPYKKIKNLKVNLAKGKSFEKVKIDDLVKKKVFANEWHAYWVHAFYSWFIKYGAPESRLRLLAHPKEKLAHYAKACIDIEFKFPFGWKELHGDADRGVFDLTAHQDGSGKSHEIFDEVTSKKFVPYVAAEPSQGIERAILVFLFSAYCDDKKRGNVVLKLHPAIAPIKVAILPLVKKDGVSDKAKEVYDLLKEKVDCFYDESGSIGRRYARQDELGTPKCITVDYESLDDDSVTVRDRDTTKQVRVKICDLSF
jgi:glycyl-tRNA synthetase